MRKRNWSLEQLKNAVEESFSIRSVIIKLGLIPAGGNYDVVKRIIAEQKIDTSHFTGMGWKKGNDTPVVPKRSLDDILRKDSTYQSHKLKERLFEIG